MKNLPLTALLSVALLLVASTQFLRGQDEGGEGEKPQPEKTDDKNPPDPVLALLEKAQAAIEKLEFKQAIKLLDEAVSERPLSLAVRAVRASTYSLAGDHENAIRDYDMMLKRDPTSYRLFDRRGDEHFKAGKMKEAVADYDRFLAKAPQYKPRHWRRGIAYYYTEEWVRGQKQFEGYQTVDNADVENAVWRYLCMARKYDTKKARSELLRVGLDFRVPMSEIYRLFAGEVQPEEVLAACKADSPDRVELNSRLFYAHLYLGLYYETEKSPKKAHEHLRIATKDHRIGHFMWDVARVHFDRYENAAKKSAKD